jgi:hypothetical protein
MRTRGERAPQGERRHAPNAVRVLGPTVVKRIRIPGRAIWHARSHTARFALGAVVVLTCTSLGVQEVLARSATSHPSPPPGPRCAPARLDASALLSGTTLTVSPLPGSYDASPRTQISLLGAPASEIEDVGVRGSQTGAHAGKLEPYSQGDGASFVLAKPLRSGESVEVSGVERSGSSSVPFSFSFTVATRDPIPYIKPEPNRAPKAGESITFHSLPRVTAPAIKVITSLPGQEHGDIFTAPYSGPSQDGPMIFDNTGQLVWFDPLPAGIEATNLREQTFEGKPVLSWWQGYIPREGFGEGEEIVVNSSYRKLMHVRAGNGYRTDLHDFHITAQDTALLTVFNPVDCNTSSVGGPSDGAVTDGVFEEIDLHTGLVRREWHSLDHVPLSASYSPARGTGISWPYDYFHINTIEPRQAGGFLISARNTSALYFIDPQTGKVTLQIGGKNGNVHLGSGAATAYQHDAQELPDGDLSIFDNGGVPMVHSQSRAIVVSLDSKSDTLSLVAQYDHDKPLRSGSQGDVELLEDGNFFVGWGQVPYYSEYTASGKTVFDARLPQGTESYRAYRFAWEATPAQPPAVAVGEQGEGSGTPVFMSWNGATGVASWRVLAGASPSALSQVASGPRKGFETEIEAPGEPAYVAVEALDSTGKVLGTSKTIKG